MPFIKLAQRDMALVVYFAGDAIRPGTQEEIERKAATQLKNTYRIPVLSYRREGAFVRFQPDLEMGLVEKSIDDVVVVDIATADHEIHGHVQVLAMYDHRVVVDRKFKVESTGTGVPVAKIVNAIWVSVARWFTDPGASPELDLQRAADRLADQGACRQAVSIYARALRGVRPLSINDAQRFDASRDKQAECKRKLSVTEELERDKKATYSLSLEVEDLSPRMEEAVRNVFRRGGLNKRLETETAKPSIMRVTPAAFALAVRFDAKKLEEGIDERPAHVGSERAVYLDVYYNMMAAVSEFREEVADACVPSDAAVLRDLPLTLKLTKPGGDTAALDFATLDGRILLTDSIRIKVNGTKEIPVETEAKQFLREGMFVIGPSNDAEGALTTSGLVYKFFELAP